MLRYFIRRRTIWCPTLLGGLTLLALVGGAVVLTISYAHGFLAVSEREASAEVLVIEGWLPDYALAVAVKELETGEYSHVCVGGGPLDHGNYLSSYRSYAELSAASLKALGVAADRVIVAPAANTRLHRTYESARAVRRALEDSRANVAAVNVLTLGVHARRSRLVFKKEFGDIAVGVISVPREDYDPARWWASSAGARVLLVEGVAWMHEWLFDSGRE